MGNELKLSLENFQSISNGELIFHTGTNVIVGQSNSGKTATFRALKACLANPSGSQRFIKNGNKQATVILEYNGNQIVWKRTAKESSYIINNETYLKTGSSNAFKIINDTGFVRDDNDIIMNIEEELQLPFPFGISKSELFKLFENVFCISDSSIILKSAKEQEDNVKSEITLLENELIKNKNKLKELAEFKSIFDINKLQSFKNKVKDKQNKVNFLKDGLPIIKQALRANSIDFNNCEYNIDSHLPAYEELLKTKKEIVRLKQLHNLGKSLPAQNTFSNKIQEYSKLIDLNNTKETIMQLNKLQLPTISITSKIDYYKSLIKYKKEINTIINQIKILKGKQEDSEKRIKELEDKLKQIDVCPLCGRPF